MQCFLPGAPLPLVADEAQARREYRKHGDRHRSLTHLSDHATLADPTSALDGVDVETRRSSIDRHLDRLRHRASVREALTDRSPDVIARDRILRPCQCLERDLDGYSNLIGTGWCSFGST